MYSINDLTLEEVQLIVTSVEYYKATCFNLCRSPYSSEDDKVTYTNDLEKTKQLLDKLKEK